MAARNGATLTPDSIASVTMRPPNVSGTIAGDIADRSLGNYMPHLEGYRLSGTQITGGQISTTAIGRAARKPLWKCSTPSSSINRTLRIPL